MSDQAIKYAMTADTSGFEAGMQSIRKMLEGVNAQFTGTSSQFGKMAQGMSQHMKDMGESISSSVAGMGGHFSGLLEAVGQTRGGFVALGLAAAGIGAAKAAAATAEMTESAMDLARVLGTSTNEAQAWRLALEDVGASQGELEGAAKGLSKNLKENEADMQAMGLQTRDAAGNLRPMTELLTDGVEILNGYAEGADRALAGQALFGRGVDASSKLLLLNRDAVDGATETMKELGLEVGANAVAAWKDYDDASDRAAFTMRGLGNTIGTIVMPVITQLINTFNAAMPAAIVVVQGAVGGLTTAFHGLTNGVVIVWETIKAMIFTVTEPLRALGAALFKLASGDFKGATQEMMGWTDNVAGTWAMAMDKMVASSEETSAKIAAIWAGNDSAPGTPVGRSGGTQRFVPPPKKEKDKPDKEPEMPNSFMQYYEAVLDGEQTLATERDALHGMSKAAELKFWEDILATAQLTGADQVAVARKIAAARMVVLREQAQEQVKLDDLALGRWQERELAGVALAEQAARDRLATGEMTQAQLLSQEEQFEQRRNQIRMANLEARRGLLDPDRDVVQIAQINQQLEQLELQHQARLGQIRGQAIALSAKEIGAIWADLGDRIGGLWDKGIAAMMNGTLTFKNAFKAIGTEMTGWFIQSVIGEQVKAWMKAETLKMAAKFGFLAQEKIATLAGSDTAIGAKITEATAVVGANAAEAATGAAAAVSPIPIVGPGMALAAFAGIMALTLGAKSLIPSAAGGFDIPAGMNPLTQLHEREMVLPAKYGNLIRDMADGGDSSPRRRGENAMSDAESPPGKEVTVHITNTIHAMDGASVKRVLTDNHGAVATALRKAMRNFHVDTK